MSESGGTTTSTATTDVPAYQKPYVTDTLAEAKKLYQTPGPSYYPGQAVAPFTAAETAGQDSLMSFASGLGDKLAGSENALNFLMGDVMSPESNPYLKAAVEGAIRPMYQNLTETVLPAIRGSAVAGGNQGSSRQALAEAKSIEGTQRAAGDVTSSMYSDAYSQGLQAMLQGLNLTPSILGMGAVPGEVMSGVGAQQRGMEQANIDADREKWQYEQNLPFVKLAEYANMVRGPFGAESSSTVVEPETGTLEQILGSGMSITSLISQIYKALGG